MENMKRNATIVAIYRALSSLLETHNFDSIRSMTSVRRHLLVERRFTVTLKISIN